MLMQRPHLQCWIVAIGASYIVEPKGNDRKHLLGDKEGLQWIHPHLRKSYTENEKFGEGRGAGRDWENQHWSWQHHFISLYWIYMIKKTQPKNDDRQLSRFFAIVKAQKWCKKQRRTQVSRICWSRLYPKKKLFIERDSSGPSIKQCMWKHAKKYSEGI